MKYRKLGRTGAQVSELIFGCGNVGGIMIHADADIMQTAIGKALDAGINWFDTAASYGDGASEENLGRVLEGIDDKPYVSTKVRINPNNTEDIYGQIERSLHQSLERLRLERIDLFSLHNGMAGVDGGRSLSTINVMGREGAFDAIEKLRAQGLVNWIGMTALGDASLCCRLIQSGRIDTAQVYYNIINPTAARLIPKNSFGQAEKLPTSGQNFTGILEACQEWNVGVIAIRALAAGVLATDVRHGRESAVADDTTIEEEERKARAVADYMGDRYGTRAQAALRFVLSHPAVSTIDFAISNPEQFDEGLQAVELGKLPADALQGLSDLFESDFGQS